jgi:hypothetical protein
VSDPDKATVALMWRAYDALTEAGVRVETVHVDPHDVVIVVPRPAPCPPCPEPAPEVPRARP